MEEIEYKIWFSRLNLSNKVKQVLLSEFKSCKNLYNLKCFDVLKNKYGEKIVDVIQNPIYRRNLERDFNYMTRNCIKILNKYDNDFPKKLLQISDCPTQIFVKGNLELLYENNIGIIGSRKASEYGKFISRSISKDFACLGINVVSGLATGIDKFAHLGALDSLNGRTIAVLGNGISKDALYPYENLILFDRIFEEGGCIVSEYPCFFKACSYTFPARNRIISGLSDKLLVVEAGPKSGSLITVEFALEQGKDVYAVPGNINNYNSIGTNKLIQEGAIPFLNVNDCFI